MNIQQHISQLLLQGENNVLEFKSEQVRPEAGLVHYDIAPVYRAKRDSLSDQKLHEYFSSYYQINFIDLSREEQEKILLNTDILQEAPDGICASVGGLLLFAKQPQRWLPASSFNFAVFKGENITDELVDKKELLGTLPEIIDQAVSLIKLFIPVKSSIEGAKRKEEILISAKTIREAVVNAVCHRDYSLYQRKNNIYIFSNRIEIASAGKVPNTLTLEKIRYGNSAARNPFLLKYLDNMRYIDGLGRGVPLIIQDMGNRAVWEEIGEILKLTLYLK